MGLPAPKLCQDLLAEGAADLAQSCSCCGWSSGDKAHTSPVGYLDSKKHAVIFITLHPALQLLSGLSI